jgi:hypothetical protein
MNVIGNYLQPSSNGGNTPVVVDDAFIILSTRLVSQTTPYTGPLVRIRRSSDGAQKDFYPDNSGKLSLSSEDGAGLSLTTWIGANDGTVVTWYDQSGNNKNFTNSNPASQPFIVISGALSTSNGYACVLGDPANTSRSLTTTAISAAWPGISTFIASEIYATDNTEQGDRNAFYSKITMTGSGTEPYFIVGDAFTGVPGQYIYGFSTGVTIGSAPNISVPNGLTRNQKYITVSVIDFSDKSMHFVLNNNAYAPINATYADTTPMISIGQLLMQFDKIKTYELILVNKDMSGSYSTIHNDQMTTFF